MLFFTHLDRFLIVTKSVYLYQYKTVSDKSARSSDKSARRNDDAPLATDVFDEGQCDFPANY